MAALLPNGKQCYITATGIPLAGGRLYTYDAGTSTPRPTYSDAAGLVPNTNPVILDSRGEATVFWSGAYKVILRDSTDAIVIPAIDNIVSADTYANTNDAALRADLASVIGATKNAGQVGYNKALAYAAGTVGAKLREFVSVKDFGAVGDGTAIDTTAILAAVAFAKANNVELVFPAGTYKYGTPILIDWTGARISFSGKVTLLYTGATAYAVAIDGGASTGAVFDVHFGVGSPPIIQAVGTTSAMFCRAVGQNSMIELKCTAALTRALLVNFAVCASFKVCVSNNVDGYIQVPTNGVQLDPRGPAELVSACDFYFVVEGINGDGVVSTAAVHCNMYGTSEGNTGRGYVESGLSESNVLINMDNEVNGGADYALGGYRTLLLNTLSISSTASAVVTGLRNVLQGATFKKLNITSAAYGTVLREVSITAGSGGGNLTDAGINTVYENCYTASDKGTSPLADSERKPMMKSIGGMTVFSATQAAACIVTIANNGLENIESITFSGVGGMVQLNGNTYQVEPINNSNSFYILTAGTFVNSTGFGAFTSGGTGTVVAFTGAWANTGGALRTCGYKKDADGTVHLFGSVQTGGTGNPIFTLPVGYRPLATLGFNCVNTQIPELALVTITVGGVVTPTFATAAAAKISLDNISFMAEV